MGVRAGGALLFGKHEVGSVEGLLAEVSVDQDVRGLFLFLGFSSAGARDGFLYCLYGVPLLTMTLSLDKEGGLGLSGGCFVLDGFIVLH